MDGADRLLRELESQAIGQGGRPLDLVMLRDRVTLGATLLSLRIARGLSQQELSQISGVEQADISQSSVRMWTLELVPCCGYSRAWPHG